MPIHRRVNTRMNNWVILAVPLALAACHSSPTVEAKNATPEEVAKKVADSGLRLDPGRWEATSKIEKMDMPGMTPEIRDAMTKSMSTTTFATCLTAEQAAHPDAGFFQKSDKNSACKFSTFTMTDGKIDATFVCNQGDMKQTMTMNGSYGSDSYNVHVDMNGTMQGQPMTMAMTTTSKHVGACKGDELGSEKPDMPAAR